MKVTVIPVKRIPVQYTLPQDAASRAVRAELRAKLLRSMEKERDVFSPFNTSNS